MVNTSQVKLSKFHVFLSNLKDDLVRLGLLLPVQIRKLNLREVKKLTKITQIIKNQDWNSSLVNAKVRTSNHSPIWQSVKLQNQNCTTTSKPKEPV